MSAQRSGQIVTAGVLIIGNEILSGRTQDANLVYIARALSEIGVLLREARVVPDIREEIVPAMNELRLKFDYVFTTGGIGPTHDDITLKCLAQAFQVPLTLHPEAHAILRDWYKDELEQLNAARLRMATAPEGSIVIVDPRSGAMGFRMSNVFAMAGIPQIMQSMFDHLKSMLKIGPSVISRSVACDLPEGTIAQGLEEIQKRYPEFDLGSYPWLEGNFGTSLVVRGRNPERLEMAVRELIKMVRSLGGHPEIE
jgi:molybdenum cofactor synthesis domain-containing protein